MARTRRKSIAGPVLSQLHLARLRQWQRRVKSLQADLAEAKKVCVRQDTLARLILGSPGAVIEPGPLTAAIEITQRRNVPWKAVFVEHNGLALAEKIAAEWPPDEAPHVVVSEIGAPAALVEVA